MVSHNYAFAAYGLFLAGGLAIIGGVFGWCGIWRENRAIILCVSGCGIITMKEVFNL